MVYVHSNLHLIYRKREENSTELALANMDLNDPVLELVTFDNGYPMEGSSSTSVVADRQMGGEEEEEEDC